MNKLFWIVVRSDNIEGMFFDQKEAHKLANELREKDHYSGLWPHPMVIVYRENLNKIKEKNE